jgi:hypothetical protein
MPLAEGSLEPTGIAFHNCIHRPAAQWGAWPPAPIPVEVRGPPPPSIEGRGPFTPNVRGYAGVTTNWRRYRSRKVTGPRGPGTASMLMPVSGTENSLKPSSSRVVEFQNAPVPA